MCDRIRLRSPSLVVAVFLFGVSCSKAGTSAVPPEDPARAFLLAHVEQARREGGEEEVWRMLSDELRYGLVWEEWCRAILEYVKEKGTTDMLSAIDSLLRPPKGRLSGRLRGWPSATVRTLASEAWCLIGERECATKAEKLELLAAFLDTITAEPPLTPGRQFCQGFMKSLLPESRAIVYDVLKDPARSYGYEQSPGPRTFLEAALDLPEFRPTEEEKRIILSRGGTFGKVLLLERTGLTPETEAQWRRLKTYPHLRAQYMAYQNILLSDLAGNARASIGKCKALDDYLAFLTRLQLGPPAAFEEELKYEGMSLLACLARRHGFSAIREYAAAFLAGQPEPKLKDLVDARNYRMDQIDEFAEEVRRIARYRKKAREMAQYILDNWGKWPSEKSGSRGENGEPRIRWFLDGKELPANEGPAGGDM